MLDVLVYVADGMLLDGHDYANRIEERLSADGLTTDRRDLTALTTEKPPPARAYVFTGGETSVHSDKPWMRAAIDTARGLMADADRLAYSVIGICLGSQIMAEALRPNSIMSATAIEVGLIPVTRPEDHQSSLVVPSFHYQAITPEIVRVPGVRIEWRNAHSAVQAFSYRDRSFGCQFHPELSAPDVDHLIDRHADLITEYKGDVAAAHESVTRYADSLPSDLFDRLVIDRIRH